MARHDLLDDIPAKTEVAIARGSWAPRTRAVVTWHHFDARTFDLGREEVRLTDNLRIGLYSPERSVIDAVRLRATEGPELGVDALKTWLRGGGQPSKLLQLARRLPHAEGPIRSLLQVLL